VRAEAEIPKILTAIPSRAGTHSKDRTMIENQNRSEGRDDSDLHDDPAAPGQGGAAGGNTARDIGSRDEEKTARGGNPGPTRVTKQDKVQPDTGTQSDHEGAQKP
jgi:hypothetical protein